VRERATRIWRRLVVAWLDDLGAFRDVLAELSERELRLLVTDVCHRLLEAAGVLPGGEARGDDRPVGRGLASWDAVAAGRCWSTARKVSRSCWSRSTG
jgi:hypothetical protein